MFEIYYDDMEKELFWAPAIDAEEYKIEISQGGSDVRCIYLFSNIKLPLDIDPMPSPVELIVSTRENSGSPFEEKGRKVLK